MRAIFFIPAYNQLRQLPTVLREIEEARLDDVDFVIVNNGCTDGSAELIHDSGHAYIDSDVNRGVGFAYIRALQWALARGERYAIFGAMAANAKMLPAEIPRLIDPIREGRADYVSGSRFLEPGHHPNLPAFRRTSIPLVNLFVRLGCGHRLTDATNGFRAFRLDVIRRADWEIDDPSQYTYGFEYYLYAKFLRDPSLRCIEVPTTMRYPSAGKYSHIRPGRDWYEMLKPWMRARLDGKGFRPAAR